MFTIYIDLLNPGILKKFPKSYVLTQFSLRPDGQKKAYVRLAPDYDALDIANKIGII